MATASETCVGIIRRLDHLVDLGVDAIWLSPIFPSPMVCLRRAHDIGGDPDDAVLFAQQVNRFDRLLSEADNSTW
jgi:alpha-glucosidase